jgi:hypothetical protein
VGYSCGEYPFVYGSRLVGYSCGEYPFVAIKMFKMTIEKPLQK